MRLVHIRVRLIQIIDLYYDLLTGGPDTSATLQEWTFNELLKHPEVLNKAREELDRVIGRERWVEKKDCTQLP
ncbi:hypothetical protein KY284_027531 [Solanum tuberosum]|nr:hypothetical protein KY284_027531 [Solanum tuberosum]